MAHDLLLWALSFRCFNQRTADHRWIWSVSLVARSRSIRGRTKTPFSLSKVTMEIECLSSRWTQPVKGQESHAVVIFPDYGNGYLLTLVALSREDYHGNKVLLFSVNTQPIEGQQCHALGIFPDQRNGSLLVVSSSAREDTYGMTPSVVMTEKANFRFYRAAHRPWKFLQKGLSAPWQSKMVFSAKLSFLSIHSWSWLD